MGVHGLWRLIEPSGKPVPLETLENKVLAVDISIWLHQAIKGFQDAKGAAVPNAHLLGIYHRVCKLLYFKIKPVFIFDGGVPALKRETIAKRNQIKSKNSSEADRLQKQLLSTLLKHTAISKVLSEKTKASIAAQTKKSTKDKDELFTLPSSEMDSTLSSSEEEEFETESSDANEQSPLKQYDLHSVDTKSPYFQSLPLETRHEILTELKETRKQNSWGRLHELPKKSDDFSSFQMKRLLKRQQVQAALDDAAKEMGGASLSLTELENLLHDQGIPTSNNVGQRIASDSNTRYLYIKDVKEALEKAKLREDKENELGEKGNESVGEPKNESKVKSVADLEEEEELQRAIALSLQDEPSTSSNDKEDYIQEFSFLENFKDEDFESDTSEEALEEVPNKEILSSAQSYMMEYSGLTPAEISKIIAQNAKRSSKKPIEIGKILPRRLAQLKSGLSRTKDSNTLGTIKESVDEDGNDNDVVNNSNKTPSLPSQIQNKETIFRESICSESSNDNENIRTSEDLKAKVGDNQVKSLSDNEIIKTTIESEKINVDSNRTENEIINIKAKEDRNEKMNKNDSEHEKYIENEKVFQDKEPECAEIMSDSDSSSSEEFLVVEDLSELVEKIDNSAKKEDTAILTIAPLQDEDDLFSDIFQDKKDIDKLEEILKKGKLEKEDIETSENVENKSEKRGTNKKEATIEKTEEVQCSKTNVENPSEIKDDSVSSLSVNEKPDVIQNIENSKTEFKTPSITVPKLTISELQEMRDNLQGEKIDLLIEKSSKERLATNISDQMYQEAQELLELFGVPYVIAPMEAEAQCAFLDEIELTDGTITDDSDIWLFGGRTVYKNFFDQAKYVMEFKAENIQHHFKLSRQQMILLALLVGSDYTIGLRGVGPVTALEILSTFPPQEMNEFNITQSQLISGLKEFKAWFLKGQSGGPGRSALKSKLKNITFTENFPNVQVVQAYMEPTVETSKETFSWGKPDFVSLTLFAREKFGWSPRKTEEILNPVIKRVEESRIQRSIKEYFKTKFKLDGSDAVEKMSKRVKLAIERFGKTPEELIAEEMQLLEKERERKLKRKDQIVDTEPKNKRNRKNKSEHTDDQEGMKNEKSTVESKPKRRARTKKSSGGSSSKAEDNLNEDLQGNELVVETNSNKKESSTPTKSKKRKAINKSVESGSSKPKDNSNITDDSQKQTTRRKKKSSETHQDSVESNQGEVNPKKKKSINLLKQVECLSEKPKDDPNEELKLYENVAVELRRRRQRKNELLKIKKDEEAQQRKRDARTNSIKKPSVEVPKELEADVEVQHLLATTSKSILKVEEIHKQVQNELSEDKEKRQIPKLHKLHNKEVIHQKLRDKSDLLRNKLKAIEIFRKSKRGPGYVPKRERLKRDLKEDAGLSEDSDS